MVSRIGNVRRELLGAVAVSSLMLPAMAYAQTELEPAAEAAGSEAEPPPVDEFAEENVIIVSGYRASLQSQTNAKRESTGFTDTIFAEDIGKFPDTNIAESLNRIPGVTIGREVTGEGVNIAIRGLGPAFTKVLLNDAPVAIAAVRFDAQGTNREVDLDLLPTELFTQLTVSKSPVASQVEGGAAGTINLRAARPFDNPKPYVSYGLQGSKVSGADKWGYRGHVLASATFGAFGILVGGAAVRNNFNVDGFETIGWTNPNLTGAQRLVPQELRNTTGGGNFTIPASVPSNAGNGLTPGAVIDEAFLLANNPGATIEQIDHGLLPRLARPRTETGKRQRYNGLVSLEWRPSDNFHFYVDGMYAQRDTDFTRTSMNWAVRNGGVIPLNTTYDRDDCSQGCVVTGGTYANSQFFLEYRQYKDTQDYWGVNPGMEFTFNDWLKGDFNINYTKSTFHRENPTFLVTTPPNSGATVTYRNDGGIPSVETDIDLNDPDNFGWVGGGRVNLNGEDRETETKGVRGSLLFGDEKRFSVRVGGAYDDTSRRITPFDNTNPWQNAICGNGPSVTLLAPNLVTTPCTGLNEPGSSTPTGFPTFPGLGSDFTVGMPPMTYAGSLIPNGAVPGYLRPGPSGYVTVDWDKVKADTDYTGHLANAPETGASATGANGGLIHEKVTSSFVEGNGVLDIRDDTLRLNGGVRIVWTEQFVGGRVSLPSQLNTPAGSPPIPNGGRYPNTITFPTLRTSYSNLLPSASVAYEFDRKAVARASISRTMTRPDPNALLPGASFVQPSADVGTIGNSALAPYLSDNIDLGFEFYTGGEGVIAFAAFRKEVTGFTHNKLTTAPFSFFEDYGITIDSLTQDQRDALKSRAKSGQALRDVDVLVQQQVNVDGKLKINGLEFQVTQPLDFLTEYVGISGFGLQANLTLIDQKGAGKDPPVALGVAPVTYTITGYYEKGPISTRLTYTRNDGAQGSGDNQNSIPDAAIFGRGYSQLDFSGSLDLAQVFDNEWLPTLVLNATNLTKEAQGSYFQFPNATFNEYNPGRTVLVGIRGTF